MKTTVLILVAVFILLVFFNLNAQDAKKVSKDSEVTLSVNMNCNNCVEKVKKQLAFTKGVKDVAISLEKQIVTVTYRNDKTDTDKLISSLAEIGYVAKLTTPTCSNSSKQGSCCGGKEKKD